jgi:site-specific recombinase XerD
MINQIIRHTAILFQSQLAMKGVGLHTVQELTRHADMKMAMRYAHLAPNYKLQTVELQVYLEI